MKESYREEEVQKDKEPPDLFSIFQFDLENIIKLENKLLLYKNIPLGSLDHLPFYRVNMLLDDWLDDIEKKKEQNKKQKKEQEQKQKEYQSQINKTSGSPSMPKIPKPSGWKY